MRIDEEGFKLENPNFDQDMTFSIGRVRLDNSKSIAPRDEKNLLNR